MSRIAATFESLRTRGRKALITFVTAGDPEPALTVPLMHALAKAGADVIELGVPFSDPMADGPVIQRASERALARGVRLADVLGFVAGFRKTNAVVPVVLMGYANPIESMGLEEFAGRAQAAGVDGVLVVDYPPEEARDFAKLLESRGLDAIFLLAPTTTEERMRAVAQLARGYLYYVSLRGVTGANNIDVGEVGAAVKRIGRYTGLPIGVGFGIRDGATAKAVAGVADAVVIGSRLVQEIEASPPGRVADQVGTLVKEIRNAIDAG